MNSTPRRFLVPAPWKQVMTLMVKKGKDREARSYSGSEKAALGSGLCAGFYGESY